MNDRGVNSRRTRLYQFETLEDRSLLNAAIPAHLAAEVHAFKAPKVQVLTLREKRVKREKGGLFALFELFAQQLLPEKVPHGIGA